MKNRSRLIRKITNLLGITFITLGMIPVPVLSQIGSVYAQVEDGAAAVDLPAFVSYTELLGSTSVELDTAEIDLPKFASYAGLLDSTSTEDPPAEEPPAEEPPAEEPVAEEPPAEEPVAEEPPAEEPVAEEPVAEEPVCEEGEECAPEVVEEPVAEEPVCEEGEECAPEVVGEPAAETPETEVVAEIVAAVAENDLVLVDESGESLDMASQETAEILTTAAADPYFTSGGLKYCFVPSTVTCPITGCNICDNSDDSPIQRALIAAVTFTPDLNTIYVEAGTYHENVLIDTDTDFVLNGLGVVNVDSFTLSATVTTLLSWLNINTDLVHVITDSDSYGSINDAIYLVSEDGVVEVGPGTYKEEVDVDKDGITITGLPDQTFDLIPGAGANAPILDGSKSGGGKLDIGFNVDADGVTIQGFNIRNFIHGVEMQISGNPAFDLLNNTIHGNVVGFYSLNSVPQIHVNYNIFYENTDAAMENAGGGDQFIDATSNYWGCAAGPIIKVACSEYVTWGHAYTSDQCYDDDWIYLGWVLSSAARKPIPINPDDDGYCDCQILYGHDDKWSIHLHAAGPWDPYKIELDIAPTCGDYLLNVLGETCDPPGPITGTSFICRADCTFCGDGFINGGEECDGGPNCRPDCTIPECGDGILDAGEDCDPGIAEGLPGYDENCRLDCTIPECGDGILDAGEDCDPGIAEGLPGYDENCRLDCTIPECGDGILDAGEDCDPGIAEGLPGYDENCRLDCTIPECGDGILDAGEDCDPGIAEGLPGYDENCRLDCTIPECGDGILDAGEDCDPGIAEGLPGYDENCRLDCTIPECGDGILDAGEDCDPGIAEGLPGYDENCRLDCTIPECGDGILDAGEDCDPGIAEGLPGYDENCRLDCTIPECGDGILDAGEDCDPGIAEGLPGYDENCRLDCTIPECGDGILDAGEDCDPGIAEGLPGYDENCRLDCTIPECGDGILDAGEDCDPGIAEGLPGYDENCRLDCTIPECGDGILDAGEDCDPGIAEGLPGYDENCRLDCTIPECGDGILDAGEDCDPGIAEGLPGYDENCRLDCTIPECGDGILDAGEDCDPGIAEGLPGYDENCRLDCTIPECGDGILDAGEDCDPGIAEGLPGYDENCRLDCTIPECGDGILDEGETCDPPGSATSGGICRDSCTFCGDGIVNDGESCDGEPECSATCTWPLPIVFAPAAGPDLITAGIGHTCALTTKDGLECWGLNESGQVGDSSFVDKLEPVDVVGIDPTSVIGLVSGIHHTCVLTSANDVYCWGLNSSGQLGDGTTDNSNVPVYVDGLEGRIISISAGAEFTCALNSAREVFCWGNNSSGQLNDGTEDNSSIPVKTTTVSSDTVLISGGSVELQGITSDGAVQLWNSQPIIPVTGYPEENNSFVSADRFTEGGCSMTNTGDVNCWGGITNAEVVGAVVSKMLASGAEHACTMKPEGLVCWGSNSNGQLGDDSTDDSDEEVLVVELEQGVIALAAGEKHTCVIYSDETVACWGHNVSGQLGNSTTYDSMVPVNTK